MRAALEPVFAIAAEQPIPLRISPQDVVSAPPFEKIVAAQGIEHVVTVSTPERIVPNSGRYREILDIGEGQSSLECSQRRIEVDCNRERSEAQLKQVAPLAAIDFSLEGRPEGVISVAAEHHRSIAQAAASGNGVRNPVVASAPVKNVPPAAIGERVHAVAAKSNIVTETGGYHVVARAAVDAVVAVLAVERITLGSPFEAVVPGAGIYEGSRRSVVITVCCRLRAQDWLILCCGRPFRSRRPCNEVDGDVART